ncbi:GDP-mannose 4,6-dehydratase [bacterium]|nr:GDP-mannose 4,6-dehydratase [bacterium]
MKVLVTGAEGFVAPYLIRELRSRCDQIVASVYSLERRDQEALDGVPLSEMVDEVIELDVSSATATGEYVAEIKPDIVCHLAGISFAPAAAANFSLALQVNVGGVFHICQAMADHVPAAHLLFISSGEIYGRTAVHAAGEPIHEELPCLPMNPYAVSKLQAEEIVHFFERRDRLRATIARPFNHIGPRQAEQFVTATFAAQLAKIAHGKAEPVLKVGNLEARRDFTDVRDIARGYVELLFRSPPSPASGNEASSSVYNLSSDTSHSIESILTQLIDFSGLSVEVTQDPNRMRPAEVPQIVGGSQKITQETGWKPTIPLEQSLQDIYSYWHHKLGRHQ